MEEWIHGDRFIIPFRHRYLKSWFGVYKAEMELTSHRLPLLKFSRNEQKTHTMRDTAVKLYIRLKMLLKASTSAAFETDRAGFP